MKVLNYQIIPLVIIMLQHGCTLCSAIQDDEIYVAQSVFTKEKAENLGTNDLSTIIDELIVENQIGFLSLTPIRGKKFNPGRRQKMNARTLKEKCKDRCRNNRKVRKNNMMANKYLDIGRLVGSEREVIDHSRKMGRLHFWNT